MQTALLFCMHSICQSLLQQTRGCFLHCNAADTARVLAKKGLAKCFSGKALTHPPKPSLLPSPPKPSTEAAGKLGTQSTVRRQLVSVPWLVLGETEACRLEQLAGSWSQSCVTAALGQPLSQPLQNHGVALWDLLFLTISHRVAHACSRAEPHGYE